MFATFDYSTSQPRPFALPNDFCAHVLKFDGTLRPFIVQRDCGEVRLWNTTGYSAELTEKVTGLLDSCFLEKDYTLIEAAFPPSVGQISTGNRSSVGPKESQEQ